MERLGTEHGLSHNSVHAALEDRRGFLWFGTRSGLNRYDGREFLVYGHDPADPHSLGSSWIHALLEDGEGRLLVGTQAGLYRLLEDDATFARIPLARSASEPAVTALAAAPDGTVWVGADGGLFRLDATLSTATTVGAAAWGRIRQLRPLADGSLYALEEASARVAIVRATPPTARQDVPYSWSFGITGDGGLWIDPRQPRPSRSLGSEPIGGFDGVLTSSLTDTRDRLWIGTQGGLFIRAPGGAPLSRVPLNHLGLAALTQEITDIAEDRVGTVWLGTFGGVLRFDPNRKAFSRLVHREGDAQHWRPTPSPPFISIPRGPCEPRGIPACRQDATCSGPWLEQRRRLERS